MSQVPGLAILFGMDIERCFREEDREFLHTLAKACREWGGQACLVGGSVRSAVLGEQVADFDVEVFGLAPERLERGLQALAAVNRVGKSFGVYKIRGRPVDIGLPRRERKTGEGHRGFEICIDPSMSIAEAALRRDFTFNAIYYDLERHELVDPLGGLSDLRAGILRHCSPRFAEDSLRVLRGMQFAARLEAKASAETLRLCRGLDPHDLSPERFFGEWEKLLLKGKRPSMGLEFLKACHWLRFYPELMSMDLCPQDPRWHPEGNVFEHTRHCLDAFAAARTGSREEDLIVGLAVLCHDMGKPATTVATPEGIQSHGHEAAGVEPARTFMERLNVPGRLLEQVLPLVKCHMRPAMLYRDKSSPAAIRRLARDCGRLDRLLRVFRADAGGRPPLPDTSAAAAEWIQSEAKRLRVERSRPKRLLTGKDLLARGWKPGRELGRWLEAAYEKQLDGHFSHRAEAIAWLERQGAGKD